MPKQVHIFLIFALISSVFSAKIIAQNPVNEIHALNQQAIQLWTINPSQSIEIGKRALQFANEINNDSLQSETYRSIGGGFYWSGFYDSATFYYQQAKKMAVAAQYHQGISSVLNNMGLLQENLGNYREALELLFESLHISRQQNDRIAQAVALNNIGLVYQKLKNYSSASHYLHASLKLKLEKPIPVRIAYSYNYLGDYHMVVHDFDSAKHYYQLAEQICRENENKIGLSVALAGLGRTLEASNEAAKALNYYQEAIQIKLSIQESVGLSQLYHYMARAYFSLDDTKSALFMLQKAQQYAYGLGAKEQISRNYKLLADIHSQNKRLDSANFYLLKHLAAKDSVFNDKLLYSIESITLKAQTDKAEQELALRDLDLEKRRISIFLLSLSVALLFILFVLVLNRYRLKNRSNELLRSYNAEILQQNEEIESQKDALSEKNTMLEHAYDTIHQQKQKLESLTKQQDAIIKEKTIDLKLANKKLKNSKKELDTFIYKTSHDIRGPLARLIGLSNVALMDISEQRALEYFEKLNYTANNLNTVLTRLLSVNEINNMDLIIEPVKIKHLIEEVFHNRHDMDKHLKLEMINNVPEEVLIKTDKRLLKNILFLLVDNAVKFRNEMPNNSPIVRVEAYWKKTKLQLHVQDNGIGIAEKYQHSIFEMFGKANNNIETAGLGLFIAKLSVEKLHGEIDLISNPQGLTDFRIKLPKLA